MLVAKKENKSFFFAVVVKLKRKTCIAANDNEKLIPDGYIKFKENRLGNDSEKESKLTFFQCL